MDLIPHDVTSPDAPATPESGHRLVPGKLRGEATLTLQTQQAARLVRGRTQTAEKSAIIGLLGFAARCRTIGHGAHGDDPYAYWWQQRVDSALADAQSVIDVEEGRLDALVAPASGLTVTPARSEKPARIALNFSNPDAFRAAQLIATYDQLACRTLTLGHTGQVTRQDTVQTLNTGGRAVRRALQSAVGYRFFGIDRIAVFEQNERAVQARHAMGECPETLLESLEAEVFIVGKDRSAADSGVSSAVRDVPKQSEHAEQAQDTDASDVVQEITSHGTP